jgi:beta-mannosidase
MHFDGTLIDERVTPLQALPLASTAVPPMDLGAFDAKATFVELTLEQHDQVLASNLVYFAKPLDLMLPEPSIAAAIRPEPGGYVVELHSDVLARAVQLDFGDLDAKPDDNFFDLLPNQPRRVHVSSKALLSELQAALRLRSIASATR